jgi:hypothetical protein
MTLQDSAIDLSNAPLVERLAHMLRPNIPQPLTRLHSKIDGYERTLFFDIREVLYEYLSIIDNKTNAVLQLNGILLAVYGILYGNLIDERLKDVQYLWMLGLGVGLSALAMLLLMTCVHIHWTNFAAPANGARGALEALVDVRDSRTNRYNIAYWMSIISISLIALFVALNHYALAKAVKVI